ncbi:MAG: hypothetical protein Q9182_003728 [Xanthomendoza sp. 2 TL-2023]
MGKTRSHPAPGDKAARYVSTSSIFKKYGTHLPIKDNRQRYNGLRQCPSSKTGKRKRRTEHPLSEAFSGTIEESRQNIDDIISSRLGTVRDALIAQTRTVLQDARDQVQKVDSSSKNLQSPLEDELLEFTRKDGTVITMTLGKRMNAYRKLVDREKENLDRLSTQWQEVTKEINNFATQLFGAEGIERIHKGTDALMGEIDSAGQQALLAQLETEKERARIAAAEIGAKAIKKMKMGEKDLTVKHKNNMLQLCHSIFGEEED